MNKKTCANCKHEFESENKLFVCPVCASPLNSKSKLREVTFKQKVYDSLIETIQNNFFLDYFLEAR